MVAMVAVALAVAAKGVQWVSAATAATIATCGIMVMKTWTNDTFDKKQNERGSMLISNVTKLTLTLYKNSKVS